MNTNLKIIGRLGAVLAFLFCLLGGVWILKAVIGASDKDNAIWIGMGLYFVGKAFFVGPMLWLATEQLCSPKVAP
jgi:hypothetical protein